MNENTTSKRAPSIDFLTSTVTLAILAGIAYFVFSPLARTKMDFYNELWGPAHLLMRGNSPYDTASLDPELPAVWLPMAIGVFAPLGLLKEQVALKIWLSINIIELAAIVWLITRHSMSALLMPIMGLFAYFFPPTINHFALGQFSITSVFCLMISVYFLEKHFDWVAGIFLALGLAKPQLGLLAIFGLGIFFINHGGLQRALLFGARVLIATLVMSLPLFIAYPEWIPDWIASFQSNNYEWLHPSLFSVFERTLGIWGYAIWGVLTIALCVLCYQIWTRMPPRTAMLWSLGLTTIITPYIWSWDFVLLLPIWFHTFTQVNWKRKIFLSLTYLVGWAGIASIQLSANNNNYGFWWVPLWYMISIAFVTDWTNLFPRSTLVTRT